MAGSSPTISRSLRPSWATSVGSSTSPPLVAFSGQVRGNTESDYQRDITQYLGWRPFNAEVHTWLREWIVEQVAQHLYVEDLVEQASARLRTHRIVLPGRTVFERTVNAAHADAEHRIFAHLTQHLSAATTEAMDRLLGMAPPNGAPDEGGLASVASPPEDTEDFYRFAAYPPEAKAKHILTYLQRYGELSSLDLTPLQQASVSPELLQRLSTAVQTYDAQQVRQFAPEKRHALAAAFLFDARKRLLDYLVEMHAQFMTEMHREARNAWEKEHRQARPRVRRGVTVLRTLAETVLAMVPSPEAPLATLLAQINPAEIAEAVKDCVQFEQLERHGLLHILHGKYPNFRRYFRSFVDLPFAAEPGSEGLLASLALLRQLNSGEVKELPLDVETSFVPAAWRGSLHARCPFHKFATSNAGGALIRPGWIESPFKWFGAGTKPCPSLTLLAAGLTKRCRPDQGLARIGPPIGMRVMGIVDLQIVSQARVKIVGRSVIAALEKTPRQDAKPQLHLIQPGAMLGRKVKDMLMGRIAQERAALDAALQGLGE